MTTPNPNPPAENPERKITGKIFGVGDAGIRVLEQVAGTSLPGATLVALNTDPDSLASSSATEKISLQLKQKRGLSAGGDPERSRALAVHHLPKLKAACEGADVIFIVSGLGGGAGTGVSSLLAQAAKETGALVLAFVSFPFDCEGNRRQCQAQQGFQEMKAAADGVICLPNQKLFKLIDENIGARDTFKLSNELLAEGVVNIWRLIACPGLIPIHFSDLCALLRERHGESAFATAAGEGPDRADAAVEKLLAHPMLEGGKLLSDSAAVLVSLIGGPDLKLSEINQVMEQINSRCSKAQIIMGAAVDESFGARLAITLVASRRAESLLAKAGIDEAVHGETQTGEEVMNLRVDRPTTPRTPSRFASPPADKGESFNSEMPAPARRRRGSARMRQTQLPLDIVSKGRFDKSEPTIHKGEDLDVPTYIRRGVALN